MQSLFCELVNIGNKIKGHVIKDIVSPATDGVNNKLDSKANSTENDDLPYAVLSLYVYNRDAPYSIAKLKNPNSPNSKKILIK